MKIPIKSGDSSTSLRFARNDGMMLVIHWDGASSEEMSRPPRRIDMTIFIKDWLFFSSMFFFYFVIIFDT